MPVETPDSAPESASRPLWAALLACGSLCLAACGPSTSPLTIELRTADTHAPIVNAAVEADSLALGLSLQTGDIVDDLMGRRVAFSDRAATNATGQARLTYIPGRAVRVMILAPGADPQFLLLDQDLAAKSTPWLPVSGSPSQTATMELRAGAGGPHPQ
jgi:hypothetical protein